METTRKGVSSKRPTTRYENTNKEREGSFGLLTNVFTGWLAFKWASLQSLPAVLFVITVPDIKLNLAPQRVQLPIGANTISGQQLATVGRPAAAANSSIFLAITMLLTATVVVYMAIAYGSAILQPATDQLDPLTSANLPRDGAERKMNETETTFRVTAPHARTATETATLQATTRTATTPRRETRKTTPQSASSASSGRLYTAGSNDSTIGKTTVVSSPTAIKSTSKASAKTTLATHEASTAATSAPSKGQSEDAKRATQSTATVTTQSAVCASTETTVSEKLRTRAASVVVTTIDSETTGRSTPTRVAGATERRQPTETRASAIQQTVTLTATPAKVSTALSTNTARATAAMPATKRSTTAETTDAVHAPTSEVFAFRSTATQGCVSSDCAVIRSELVKMLGRQVDPCRSYNTYVCDASDGADDLPSPVELPRREDLVEDVQAAKEKHAHVVREGATEGQKTFSALRGLCTVYGDAADAEWSDAMTFLSVFKLNLVHRGEADEEDEDPLYRAMQVSLEFGVESLLSFQRVFEYVVDASEPFRLVIGVSAHVRDFFSDWSQVSLDAWHKFYERCLSLCGLSGALAKELGAELIFADKEVSDVLQQRTDPVSQMPYLESPIIISIEDVAQYTPTTVTPHRWRRLLSEHSRSELVLHEGVLAYPRALSLANLVSRPERRHAMRLLLGWHLLRFLLAPKAELLAAYQDAVADAKPAGYVPDTTASKCENILANTKGVRGAALPLFDGKTRVPYGVILGVGNLMASVQNAAASVLLHDPSEMRHLHIGRSTGFPQSAWSADGFSPFWLLADLGPGFLRDWLTTLRAWHVLPPVVQAHLALLVGVVGSERHMHRYFLPPHFYEHGLAAYNYAALGQIIAHGLARHLVQELPEAHLSRWMAYWKSNDIAKPDYMYCLHADNHSPDAGSPASRLDERNLTGSILEHTVASRLAYLAFSRNSSDRAVLPHVALPPAVLFSVFHCSYSCHRADRAALHPSGEDCMVAFRWAQRFTDLIPCGAAEGRGSRSRCRYV